MSPAELSEYLQVMKDAGVRCGTLPGGVQFEFHPMPVPLAQLVGKDGKPVDLDEGAGPLAKDPDELVAEEMERDTDLEMHAANFKRAAGKR